MGTQKDKEAPCARYGNSSTIAHIRGIIINALSTVTSFVHYHDILRVKFENIAIPSTGVHCSTQRLALLCTVSIASASIKTTIGYSTQASSFLWGLTHRVTFHNHTLHVRVWTSYDSASEKYSRIVQPTTRSQPVGIKLPTCFASVGKLKRRQCTSGLLERALQSSKRASCRLSTTEHPIALIKVD